MLFHYASGCLLSLIDVHKPKIIIRRPNKPSTPCERIGLLKAVPNAPAKNGIIIITAFVVANVLFFIIN